MPAPHTIVTRDFIDMANAAYDIAAAVNEAPRQLQYAYEDGNPPSQALITLRAARDQLDGLIAEIAGVVDEDPEGTPTQPRKRLVGTP